MLTVKQIEALDRKDKLYRVLDGNGLYLEVPPTGNKRWRMRYRINGKAKMASLGVYPGVSLKDARLERDGRRALLAQGLDPLGKCPVAHGRTFSDVALEWVDVFSREWSPKTTSTNRRRLELHAFPEIGDMPIERINAQDMLRVVNRSAARGEVEMARRVRALCSQVFRYAIPQGLVDRDPAADVTGVLPPVSKTQKHHAAITSPAEVGGLMRAIEALPHAMIVRAALKMVAYTFVRSGELRGARWPEIDIETAEWRISAERMKARRPHIVPLSKQALVVLKEMLPLRSPSGFVFPGIWTPARPLSASTLNVALRRMGYSKEEMTTHGFRSMASTLLYEHGWPDEAVERQLAHIETNQVRAAYDHAKHMAKRREMMQWYADYLDRLRDKV